VGEGTPRDFRWPAQAGTGVSKDVWMLGIGLGLMAGSLGSGA
jgi:hypothetical protein